MSGIVGIWNLDGAPVDPSVPEAMIGALGHRGRDGGSVWIDGPMALACLLNRVQPESKREIQPFIASSGTAVVFDGRLDNREEILPHVGALAASDAADSELVSAAYTTRGEDFPELLNGDYAIVIADPDTRRWVLVRDALGVRPLYYCRVGSSFLVASEIKALLAHPAAVFHPDDDDLAEHFLRGRRTSNEGATFFREVSTVAPAQMVLVTPERLIKRQYWDFPIVWQNLASDAAYQEAFRHHFFRAIKRRVRSIHPVIVSVSGGLDSSSILCAGHHLRVHDPERVPPIIGVSYISQDGSLADERQFLDEIEHHSRVSLSRFPIQQGFIETIEKQAWHTESPIPELEWRTLETMMRLARGPLGSRLLLEGHWGDQVLFNEAYVVDLIRRGKWGMAWHHQKEIPLWYTDADPKFYWKYFLSGLGGSILPNRLKELVRWARDRSLHGHPARPWFTHGFRTLYRRDHPTSVARGSVIAETLYRRVRSRYDILGMEWKNKVGNLFGLDVAFPFLDRDLISFLMGVPAEVQNPGGVPRGLLRRALVGILPPAIAGRRSKGDYSHLETRVLVQEWDRIISYLAERLLVVELGYVDGSILKKRIQDWRREISTSNDCQSAWNLADLVGLEAWLRVFWGGSEPFKGGLLNGPAEGGNFKRKLDS